VGQKRTRKGTRGKLLYPAFCGAKEKRGAPVPRFKRRGLKRRTARALHGRPMGRGPATVFFFFADFSFLFLFYLSKFKQKF
jgi:hypothetical protein